MAYQDTDTSVHRPVGGKEKGQRAPRISKYFCGSQLCWGGGGCWRAKGNPTCEQEERPSGHGDAALGGRVVVPHLGALHAHHADDDGDEPQQHRHHHEGAAGLDVD